MPHQPRRESTGAQDGGLLRKEVEKYGLHGRTWLRALAATIL
jgi:hypothetical protein